MKGNRFSLILNPLSLHKCYISSLASKVSVESQIVYTHANPRLELGNWVNMTEGSNREKIYGLRLQEYDYVIGESSN